jgi:hypothetical protein
MEVAQLLATVVAVMGGLVGIWYAGRQLRESRLASRGGFLLELDDAFVRHGDIHRRLRPGGDWAGTGRGPDTADEWIAVEDYMGLFERIEVLIEGGILDAALVDRLYGYRVSNIVANRTIRQTKLIDGRKGWTDFLRLIQRLGAEGRGFPSLNPEKQR